MELLPLDDSHENLKDLSFLLSTNHRLRSTNITFPPGGVTFFIIEGLNSPDDRKIILFVLLLLIYVIILGGNSLIIFLAVTDPKLRSPMYFFLAHLSFVDMVYTSTTIPYTLSGLLVHSQTLSVPVCFTQMFCFIELGLTTRSILTVMAYDRYLAICNPLRYTTIMTPPVRHLLIAGSWGFSTFCCMPSATLTWTRPFCGPNLVQHFWCDLSTLRRLMCINTRVDNILALTFAAVALGTTGLLILTSYILIGVSVSKMSVAERLKAIGTCTAHLIVVTVSYTAASVVYISYRVGNLSPQVRIVIAVVYAALTPCLNPMIYSLRNKELREAIRRMFGRLRAGAVSSGKDVTTAS